MDAVQNCSRYRGLFLLGIYGLLFSPILSANESKLNKLFCASVNGQVEVSHKYEFQNRHIVVDCETDTAVYEAGLDKRSSLDSIQQALFASYVTGKKPVVVIYDTDGKEGQFEYRIRKACELTNVEYISYSHN